MSSAVPSPLDESTHGQLVAENLARVRERIAAAAARAGRSPDSVTLVAVTKYVDSDLAAALLRAGCRDLGESRPQELWRKADLLASAAPRWHLIGHLQRNKVARTLPHVSLIHSVDSLRLLDELNQEAGRQGRRVPILLEINVSGDAAKTGLPPSDSVAAIARTSQLPHLEVRGLMGMASRDGDLEAARHDFRRLRELRDQFRQQLGAGPEALPELSMGMSGDFEVAIEEGATLIRIGSSLFEGLET